MRKKFSKNHWTKIHRWANLFSTTDRLLPPDSRILDTFYLRQSKTLCRDTRQCVDFTCAVAGVGIATDFRFENLIEKELGLKSKKDIIDFGIEKFNEAAKSSVLRYESEWRKIIPRVGRWADMDHDYKTMDASYTESVWWAFKNLHDKGFVYEGYKSMHICPRCGTTLSNFEVTQGYKDVTDISVYVEFELIDEPNTFFIAWTTTPWTLPETLL